MAVESRHDQGIMRRLVLGAIRDRADTIRRKRQRAKRERNGDQRPHAALVFGVGALPGIGAAVAARCSAEGMTAYVAGRDPEKLEATVAAIHSAGHKAKAITVDVADPEQIRAAFDLVDADGCRLELVVHNVGTNRPTPFLDITPEGLEKRWAADCRSGFLVGQHAISSMLEQADSGRGRGTLIFTGATASLRGKAGFALIAQAKAGLRMLSQALAREFGPEGIHVAHVIIDGAVDGIRLRNAAPDYVQAQGEDGTLNPDDIAETYWRIYQQHRSAWTQEIDLRPFKESW